jgi:hypothetical protein
MTINITTELSATVIPLKKSLSLEVYRERWLMQLIADPDLTAGDLRVAIAITFHMNRQQDGLAWPGMARLAALTRTSLSTVIRATKRLEVRGHLRVIRSRAGKKRGLNRYQPILKRAASVPIAEQSRMTLPSVTYDTTVVSSVTHKPLTEPLSKPLSYTAPTSVGAIHNKQNNQTKRVAEEERERGSREEGQTVTSSHNLYEARTRQRCYEVVRKHAPGRVGLVTRMLKAGAAPAEVLAAAEQCVEAGDFSEFATGVEGDTVPVRWWRGDDYLPLQFMASSQ